MFYRYTTTSFTYIHFDGKIRKNFVQAIKKINQGTSCRFYKTEDNMNFLQWGERFGVGTFSGRQNDLSNGEVLLVSSLILKYYEDGYYNSPSWSGGVSGQGSSDFGKMVQTIAMTGNVADIGISAAQQTIQSTRIGANFAYTISGSSKAINVVSNIFKYTPYVGLFVTVGTGSYLSIQKDPATGRPYQSWAQTGTDVGVNIATIYIGTQYGGWYGALASVFYIGVKTNVQYQMNDGLNPGMIFIMNKE